MGESSRSYLSCLVYLVWYSLSISLCLVEFIYFGWCCSFCMVDLVCPVRLILFALVDFFWEGRIGTLFCSPCLLGFNLLCLAGFVYTVWCILSSMFGGFCLFSLFFCFLFFSLFNAFCLSYLSSLVCLVETIKFGLLSQVHLICFLFLCG